MKISLATYHFFRQTIAFLLFAVFLIPSGLQAMQLAEFCMMDHHGEMEMMADHSCCTTFPEESDTPDQKQNDCKEISFCTCNISENAPGEEEFIQPVQKQILKPSETEFETPFFTSNQPNQAVIEIIPVKSDIPLWLMFDTFLM